MKRYATILCSIAFMISGFMISFMKPEPSNQLLASPPTIITVAKDNLPLDLQLGLEKHDPSINKIDTVIVHDTVQIVKYKTKYRAQKKSVEPDSLLKPAKPDTLYVPELQILIRMSKDVLMDTTFVITPDSSKCPNIQPLQERRE